MDAEAFYSTAHKSMPRSVEAWGTDDFNDAFEEELCEQPSELPLQNAIEQGGWWDSVELCINSSEEKDGCIVVEVMAIFDEEYSSSCADITNIEGRRVDLIVTIDMETHDAKIEFDGYEAVEDDDDDDEDDEFDFDNDADEDYDNSEF